MRFELPALPYDRHALEPHISTETLDYHYGKHHQAHVNTLNALVEGTGNADKSLEEILQSCSGNLFNQAAEVWNHTFYWHCLSPKGGGEPTGALADAIKSRFGGFVVFKQAFKESAIDNFGSGWTWLLESDGGVEIVNTSNADTPIAHGRIPLLTVDVWEHAYYLDYRHSRSTYLDSIWHLINWNFVALNFA